VNRRYFVFIRKRKPRQSQGNLWGSLAGGGVGLSLVLQVVSPHREADDSTDGGVQTQGRGVLSAHLHRRQARVTCERLFDHRLDVLGFDRLADHLAPPPGQTDEQVGCGLLAGSVAPCGRVDHAISEVDEPQDPESVATNGLVCRVVELHGSSKVERKRD